MVNSEWASSPPKQSLQEQNSPLTTSSKDMGEMITAALSECFNVVLLLLFVFSVSYY